MQTRRRLTYKQLRLQYLMLVSLKVLRLVSFEQLHNSLMLEAAWRAFQHLFKMALEGSSIKQKTEAVKLSRHRTAELSLGTNESL